MANRNLKKDKIPERITEEKVKKVVETMLVKNCEFLPP